MSNKELYQRVCDKCGKDVQLTIVIEELSELAKEICKYKRGHYNLESIAEELADVEIMCEQLRFIFGFDYRVEEWKKAKLERLNERINERK
jgi:NTP pyrophosphatase (non-canonical NTP hydrolase)